MAKIRLIKWGNSMGVRIPAHIIEELKLAQGQEFEVTVVDKGAIKLQPVTHPRAGWLESCNDAAAAQDHDLLEMDNDFDKDDWTWQ